MLLAEADHHGRLIHRDTLRQDPGNIPLPGASFMTLPLHGASRILMGQTPLTDCASAGAIVTTVVAEPFVQASAAFHYVSRHLALGQQR